MVAVTATASRLDEYEQRIERGLRSYVEVGTALDALRASRAYLEVAPSFEKYCKQRWDWTVTVAWQHIQSARVAKCISTSIDVEMPIHASHARALVPLLSDPDALCQVWRSLVARRPVKLTAPIIAEAVKEYRSPVGSPGDQSPRAPEMPATPCPDTSVPAEIAGVASQLLPPVLDPSRLLPGQQEKARYSRSVKSLRTRLYDIVKDYPSSAAAEDVARQVESEHFDLSADDYRRLRRSLTDSEHGRRALAHALDAKRPRRQRKGRSDGSTS